MIVVHDFKVSDNGKWLIISLYTHPDFPNTYIKSIKISCDGSYTDNACAVFDALISEEVDFTEHPKTIDITIDIDSMDGPFYMKVTADTTSGAPTTCAHKSVIETVTFYKYKLYKTLECLAKELDGCEPPQHFVDFLLRLKALEASIKVLNAEKINYYYKWFILNCVSSSCNPEVGTVKRVKRTCGCNR